MRSPAARLRHAICSTLLLSACAVLPAALFACSEGTAENLGGQDGNLPAGNGNEVGPGNNANDANQPANPNGEVPTGNANSANNANVPVTVSPNVPLEPNGPAVQFLGRFDTATDDGLHTMAWPSSQILLGFEGTKLTVTLNSLDKRNYGGRRQYPYVASTVDGGAEATYKLADGSAQYVVAQNLTPGHHVVRLTLRTEAQVGRVGYVSAVSDGNLSYTPPVTRRRLEFLGDSGLCGYGADGTHPCDFSDVTENAAVAFPNLVGLTLGAEVRNLSYSGKGLVTNRDNVDDAYKTLPILWQRTLPYDDPDAAWDANTWKPQAVVLVTGGNDYFNEIPDATTFVGTVSSFVTKLKTVYPGVVVFTAVSPMVRDDGNPKSQPGASATKRATAIAYMKQVVTNAADPNVRYLDIPGPDVDDPNTALGANGYGCDQHMNDVTHRKIAASVAASLKTQLGW